MSKNILDLNDDEIILIFSQISSADLLAMAGMCRRFRHLARYTFRLYPKRIQYKVEDSDDGHELVALDAVFRLFGPDIVELTFNGLQNRTASRNFFDLMIINCNPSKLKSLAMLKTHLRMEDAHRCQRILEHLEKIELVECTANAGTVFGAFIIPCKELKALKLHCLCKFDGYFLPNITEQLESLDLQQWGCVSGMELKIFTINVGSRTKTLVVWGTFADIRCASEDLSNLQTLKLEMLRGSSDWTEQRAVDLYRPST